MSDARFNIRANDKSKRAFNSVNESLSRMQGRIAGVVGVGGIGLLISQTAKAADQTAKLSKRLGISTEALSQYRHVSELSGVTFETLTMGWQRMTRRVAEAAQGTGEARGALQELQLSAVRLNQVAPEKQFEVLAEALMRVDNQADRVRLSMKLFDSEGVSLLQTMEGGAAGIRAMREEADKLGLTLSAQQAKRFEEVNDSFTRMKNAGKGVALTLTSEMLPAFQAVEKAAIQITTDPDNMSDWLKEVAFQATTVAFEFKDLIDLGAAYAAVATKLVQLDFEGAQAIVKAREANRASLDEDLQAFAEHLTNKKDLLDQSGLGVSTGVPAETEVIEDPRSPLTGFTLTQAEQAIMSEDELLAFARAKRLQDEQLWHDQQVVMAQQEMRLKIGYMKQTFSTLGMLMASSSKTLFRIGKVASIASAIVNTHEAVTKTMASVPYPWNIPLAVAQAAAGAVQVQSIRSQQIGGGGTVSVPSGGATAATNITDNTTPNIFNNSGLGGNQAAIPTKSFNITLVGEKQDTESVRDLIEKIADELPNMNLALTLG